MKKIIEMYFWYSIRQLVEVQVQFQKNDQGRFYFLNHICGKGGKERYIGMQSDKLSSLLPFQNPDMLAGVTIHISNQQLHFLCVQRTLPQNTSALILKPVQYRTILRLTTLKQSDTLIDFVTNAI